MSVRISTIVPVYNGEKTIAKCLNSILSQSIAPIEIIVVDDGSSDGTTQILRDYCSRFESVTMIALEHKGVSFARNAGIEAAHGDYVSFVDADDYIAPDMYEKMSGQLNTDNSDICVCGYYTIKDDITTPYVPALSGAVTAREMLIDMLIGANEGFVHTRLFKKYLFEVSMFPTDITHCEDLLFQADLLINNPSISVSYVNEPMYYYIHNSQSATSASRLFRDGEFTYNAAFRRIFNMLSADSQLLSCAVQKYRNILEYSMYSIITSNRIEKETLSFMQHEMNHWRNFIFKSSKFSHKSKLRYDFMSHFPILYKTFRLS